MSKLPAEFVKPPATQPKQRRARRTRKASLISPEPVRDPRELLLHLTEEEHQALEEARQQLQQAGSEITLEQMIHRVFAEWMMAGRTFVKPAPAPEPEPPKSEPSTDTRNEDIVARLRAFLAAPLRTWRELAADMWRTYVQRA